MSEVDKLFFTGICSCCKQPAVVARTHGDHGVCQRCDAQHFFTLSEQQKNAYLSGKLATDN